jgi:UDP-N-acetylglucosamine:LPS N-acetylglucosamine transferase
MQQAFAESGFVVSRCGYTTVMEVLALGKKAILIPTPGQTEQEYLAKHLFDQHWCYCCLQEDDLLYHFSTAKSFDYTLPMFDASALEAAVKEIMEN